MLDEVDQIAADDLKRFQDSLQRITVQDAFFERFYDRLMGDSEETRAFFLNRDIPSIIAKLRVTLMMVAEAAEGKPGLEMYLEMLGKIHRRLEVEPRFFRFWRDALIATVAEYDAQFDDGIRGAWERVIDRVIACMHQTEGEEQRF